MGGNFSSEQIGMKRKRIWTQHQTIKRLKKFQSYIKEAKYQHYTKEKKYFKTSSQHSLKALMVATSNQTISTEIEN